MVCNLKMAGHRVKKVKIQHLVTLAKQMIYTFDPVVLNGSGLFGAFASKVVLRDVV